MTRPDLRRTSALALVALAAACDPVGGGAGPAAGQPAGPTPARAVVRVAAAASLRHALDELAADFEATAADGRPRWSVAPSYGSSGSLLAQVTQRAPFDVYLAADLEHARRAVAEGLALGPPFVYAVGRLAVWAPAGSPLDLEGLGLRAVADPGVRRVAIANPRHAPYGAAAVEALRRAGLLAACEGKLVLGEDVAQAAQFVDAGGADLGLLALSLVRSPALRDRGRAWVVPADAHPPLEQGGVVLRGARDPAGARAFVDHLLGPAGRAVLARHGLGLPSG